MDDDGTFTSGTIIDKTFLDAIETEINTLVHSSSNPTVTPVNTIDEVVTARGTKANVGARLDVEHNTDGTHNLPATVVTASVLAASLGGGINLVKNPKFDIWNVDNDVVNDYVESGANIAVTKTGSGLGDTTAKIGQFAVKIASGAGGAAELTQTIIATEDWGKYDFEEGAKVVAGVYINTSDTDVSIEFDDGNTQADQDATVVDGTWNLVTVTHTISASATRLDVIIRVGGANDTAYFSGLMVLFSDTAPSRFINSIESEANSFNSNAQGFDRRYSKRRVIIEDEFFGGTDANGQIGSLGWRQSNTGTGTTVVTSANNVPGYLLMTTGASTNDKEVVYIEGGFPANIKRFMFNIIVDSLKTTMRMIVGLVRVADAGEVTVAALEGAMLYFDTGTDTKWHTLIENGSTSETEALDEINTATRYEVEFVKDSNGFWDIYLDGDLRETGTLVLDAERMVFCFGVQTLTTAARLFLVDRFAVEYEVDNRKTS